MVFVVLADGHGGEGAGFEGDAVIDGGGGDLADAADDLLLIAGECPAEDVDVACDAARAELGEQEPALEDEVLPAEWVDADSVEEAFEQVLEHDLVGGCAGTAGEVAQVVVDAAGGRVAGGAGHQASTASMAGRMAGIPPSSRAARCRSATPCWPVRRRYRLSADRARLRPSARPRRMASTTARAAL